MKTWQILTISALGALVVVLLLGLLSVMVYAIQTTLPADPVTVRVEQIPVEPIIVTVPVIQERIVIATPAPEITQPDQPVTQPIAVQSTPVPAVEEPEVKCSDAASLAVNTPYFKTFKPQVTAEVVVYNMGNCVWEASSRYIAPFSTYIPVEVLPGGFAVVQVTINTTPGLSVITPIVMGEFNESLMPQAMAAPAEFEMDYSDPVSSVPAGTIVINYPTKDWEGLPYEWPKYYRIGGWDYWCWGGT